MSFERAEKELLTDDLIKQDIFYQFKNDGHIAVNIPCIFFSTEPIHSIWTVFVIFAPQIVFIVYGIFNTLKDVKEYRATQLKQDQELKEQQKREEMGHFK